jgi:hypothetical protein
MTTKKRTSTSQKAEIARQQPTQLGVVLREGIVTALAGAFKVGAEVGRVAARATNDALDAAGRMTTRAAQAPASPVQPEVPSRVPALPKAKPGAKARRSANGKRQAKTARKPPVRSSARKTAPHRRRKTA